ncbi:hypothetical protein Cabys_355 [Caldithrix abyssi DSM 13497]|uniref:Uncharacterized protein n=1 Tax=Caldithrix abyssi DSM 13497 TaxID=880073 RepID=A0A1J1C526_CALAY|nr:hypothetical protein Cabys_355 [Caldithrix abyssi DSM 13497]
MKDLNNRSGIKFLLKTVMSPATSEKKFIKLDSASMRYSPGQECLIYALF